MQHLTLVLAVVFLGFSGHAAYEVSTEKDEDRFQTFVDLPYVKAIAEPVAEIYVRYQVLPYAEQEHPGALATMYRLAHQSGNTLETRKWLARLSLSDSPTARYELAMMSNENSNVSLLERSDEDILLYLRMAQEDLTYPWASDHYNDQRHRLASQTLHSFKLAAANGDLQALRLMTALHRGELPTG